MRKEARNHTAVFATVFKRLVLISLAGLVLLSALSAWQSQSKASATLLEDSFTGTTIDNDKWIEHDTASGGSGGTAGNVQQNGTLTASGNGSWGSAGNHNGIESDSTYDRSTGDLIIRTKVTLSNCAATGGVNDNNSGLVAYGDINFNDNGTEVYRAAYYQGTYNFYRMSNGSFVEEDATSNFTCTNNVPFNVEMNILAAGGARLYVNGRLYAALTGGSFTNKKVFMMARESAAVNTISFDDFSLMRSQPATSLSDSFSGTAFDSAKWLERDNAGSIGGTTGNVQQNDLLTLTGNGSWGDGFNQNGLQSVDTFSRNTSDLNVKADLTLANCSSGSGNNTGAVGFGDMFRFGNPATAHAYVAAYFEGQYNLYYISNGSIVDGEEVSNFTCTAGVPFTVRLVALQAGGAELYVNDTFYASVTGGSFNNKPVFFEGRQAATAVTADEVYVGNGNVPGVPLNLNATAGTNQVSLDWDAPSSDGGNVISDYTIQYRLQGAGSYSTFADGLSAATAAVVSGLDAGSYEFQVAARNAIGSGAYSTSVSQQANAPDSGSGSGSEAGSGNSSSPSSPSGASGHSKPADNKPADTSNTAGNAAKTTDDTLSEDTGEATEPADTELPAEQGGNAENDQAGKLIIGASIVAVILAAGGIVVILRKAKHNITPWQ